MLGAGTGALLGAAVAGGGTGNRLAGAAVGGLLGGLIGNRIGASMDDEDKQRAYAAQMDALESGSLGRAGFVAKSRTRAATVPWCRGRPTKRTAATAARSPTPIYIDGRPQTARGTACRNPDGTWTSLG